LNVYENKGSALKDRQEAGLPQNLRGSYVLDGDVLYFKTDNKSDTDRHPPKATERSLNVYENKGSQKQVRNEAGMS